MARFLDNEKYPVGSVWTMKEVKNLKKGEKVVITDNGEPGRKRQVIIRDLRMGNDYLISVKTLWRRVS